jgi:hypothetical protein
MSSSGTDSWSVTGVVDADGATAFRIAVSRPLSRAAATWSWWDGLPLMDVAGIDAPAAPDPLAAPAEDFPGREVRVGSADPTVRRRREPLDSTGLGVPAESAT